MAVEVDRRTGAVRVRDTYTALECGRPIVEDLVLGRLQGGLAWAIGYGLLEELPPGAEGTGTGTWNLNRYRLPRACPPPAWTPPMPSAPCRASRKN